MFDELNEMFPDYTNFYEIIGLGITEAMDFGARMAAGDPHVINYNGKIILAVQHSIDVTDNDWLQEVPGTPAVVVEEPAVVTPAKSK